VIGDVRTTINRASTAECEHWATWEVDVASDWRGLMAKDLRPLFDDLPDLRLQEEAKQNRFKLSYYLSIRNDAEALRQKMASRPDTRNLAASLIYRFDEAAATGQLDVLPARAAKLDVVEFLMRHQDFDLLNTVFAGDSGNWAQRRHFIRRQAVLWA
jgi:hypothetical protein